MEKKQLDKIKKIAVKKLSWLRVAVFLGFLIYCGYLWYVFICINQLDDSEKQVYMSTKEREVEFNQHGFEAVLGQIEQKKMNYDKSIENVPDIFRLRQ